MSAFDSGGAGTAQGCGLPDIRSAAVTNERNACTTCFGAQSTNTGEHQNVVGRLHPQELRQRGPARRRSSTSTPARRPRTRRSRRSAMTKRGMNFDVVQGIDIAEFNYAPYVQQLKDKSDRGRLLDRRLPAVGPAAAGDAAAGLHARSSTCATPPTTSPTTSSPAARPSTAPSIFTNFTPFEEASQNKETALYLSWLQQVQPGRRPDLLRGLLLVRGPAVRREGDRARRQARPGRADRRAQVDRQVDRQRHPLARSTSAASTPVTAGGSSSSTTASGARSAAPSTSAPA